MNIIYKITNNTKNMYYIGSKVNYKGNYWSSSKNPNFWNDFQTDDFSFEIIEEVDREYLIEREIYYLEAVDAPNNPAYYNLSIPGKHFTKIDWSCTEETKRKISKANKGKESWAKGRSFSDEHKAKISAAKTGVKRPGVGGRKPGYIPTEEHKAKISEALTGLKRGPMKEEHIKARSERMKGKPSNMLGKNHSAEARQKMSEAAYKNRRTCPNCGLESNPAGITRHMRKCK